MFVVVVVDFGFVFFVLIFVGVSVLYLDIVF